MLLHLIYGPTCSGKTDMAIQIAQETGWPVVALDRVQCCPQIATGSGRPLELELQSTRRIYLDSRPLTEGILDADKRPSSNSDSKWIRRKSEEGLILEGGSISLLNCMAKSPFWRSGFQWHVSGYVLGFRTPFYRAKQRVAEMFAIREDRPSLLEELAELWNYPAARPILEISTDIAAQFVLRANTISQSASCQILMQGGT